MQTASPIFQDFARAQIQTPAAIALVQLPTQGGDAVQSQIMLPDVSSVTLTRNQDLSSDSCMIAFPDDSFDFSPLNPKSTYGNIVRPGKVDVKFLLFLGFRGSNFTNTPNFSFNDRSMLLKYTGFVETDSQKHSQLKNDKQLSLLDLNKQFRFQVYDTFPHPLYGDQTLSYFDPNYNLKCLDTMGYVWQCDARMFTTSYNDYIWGSSHVNVNVFVDQTGGDEPSSASVPSTSYSFDYNNGIVQFLSPVSPNSVVSISGNPTYMSPENMIKHLLVNYANWSPEFLDLQTSGVLLPQYQANNADCWTILNDIANLTNPRFLPWVIWTDEAAVIHFFETRADGPPIKTYLDERDIFSADYEYSSRNLRTVVKADATVTTADGDQPITSIAYSVDSINKYGMTEPLTISADIVKNVRQLSIPQAVSYLNMLTASVLSQVSRPNLTLQAEVWPDPTLQISDKVRIQSKKTGINKLFLVTGITESVDATNQYAQQLTLEEYYDSVNYLMGIPAGVAGSITQAATLQTPPPAVSIIDSVRIGTDVGTFAFQGGQYAQNPSTGDQIIPIWDIGKTSSGVHFDIYLNALPAIANPQPNPQTGSYSYTNLPPGYNWQAELNSARQTVYYDRNDGAGSVLYVGPDSIFYKYPLPPLVGGNPGDYHINGNYSAFTWVPTGGSSIPSTGQPQTYLGQAATVWLWSWWYLNLDTTIGKGKTYRPVQRLYPDFSIIPATGVTNTLAASPGPTVCQFTPDSGGQWVTTSWTSGPGIDLLHNRHPSYIYNDLVVGCTNITFPPPGFEFCQPYSGHTLEVGVAFGGRVFNSPPLSYVGFEKVNRGHYCVYVLNSNGATQFLRIPFDLYL
jgi:hypothetical protein